MSPLMITDQKLSSYCQRPVSLLACPLGKIWGSPAKLLAGALFIVYGTPDNIEPDIDEQYQAWKAQLLAAQPKEVQRAATRSKAVALAILMGEVCDSEIYPELFSLFQKECRAGDVAEMQSVLTTLDMKCYYFDEVLDGSRANVQWLSKTFAFPEDFVLRMQEILGKEEDWTLGRKAGELLEELDFATPSEQTAIIEKVVADPERQSILRQVLPLQPTLFPLFVKEVDAKHLKELIKDQPSTSLFSLAELLQPGLGVEASDKIRASVQELIAEGHIKEEEIYEWICTDQAGLKTFSGLLKFCPDYCVQKALEQSYLMLIYYALKDPGIQLSFETKKMIRNENLGTVIAARLRCRWTAKEIEEIEGRGPIDRLTLAMPE